jgi:formylglycine-generating enzyme required for sulfatase activity
MSITPAQSEAAASALEPSLIQIPAAWFLMGSNSGQDCERPIHRVWIDAFLLAATQVTNAEYARFLTATGTAPPPFWQDPNFNHPQQPVSGLEQKNFPWGDDPQQALPDYATRWQTGPEPVARYGPNAFGLYDICDNVHEWCSDWYDPNYYAVSPERNPRGPEQCSMKPPRKSSRGGSWRHHIKVARCSARSSIPPEFQYADYGFRIACNL